MRRRKQTLRAPVREARTARPAKRAGLRSLYVVALVLAGAATYGNSLSGPFVFDDDVSIVENQYIRRLWPLSTALTPQQETPVAGRPLVNLSFAVNYAMGGLEVRGYHVGNVAIHILCALTLFGIVRRTLALPSLQMRWAERAQDLAFACALLWMLHPLHTEAVDYVTQRTELMMGLFYFLVLYASIRAATDRTPTWPIVAVVSCGLGMACKESMATAPLMVALYDRVFLFDSWKEAWRPRRWLYVGLAGTWLVLALLLWGAPRAASAGFSSGIDPWTYLLNQTVMIVRYVRLAIWPHPLVFDYGVPRALVLRDVWPYAVSCVALAAATIAVLRRRRQMAFLGIWFFVTLAPTSSIVPIATEVGAERRTYLPLAAIVVLAVLTADWLRVRLERFAASRPGVLPARLGSVSWSIGLLAVSAALAAGTVMRNAEYASGLTLARTNLERWPHGRAHHLLAAELAKAGHREEALGHLREAVRDDPRAYYSLGVELFNRGQADEAVEHLREFIRREPTLLKVISARETLGLALAAQGKPDEAAEQFRLVLVHRPDDFGVLTNLGVAQATLGQIDAAVASFRRAAAVDPQNGDGHRNLAKALMTQGDMAAAAVHAQRALDLRPGDPAVHALLGLALAAQGRLDEAILQLQQSLELDPTYAEAREGLTAVLRLKASPGLP